MVRRTRRGSSPDKTNGRGTQVHTIPTIPQGTLQGMALHLEQRRRRKMELEGEMRIEQCPRCGTNGASARPEGKWIQTEPDRLERFVRCGVQTCRKGFIVTAWLRSETEWVTGGTIPATTDRTRAPEGTPELIAKGLRGGTTSAGSGAVQRGLHQRTGRNGTLAGGARAREGQAVQEDRERPSGGTRNRPDGTSHQRDTGSRKHGDARSDSEQGGRGAHARRVRAGASRTSTRPRSGCRSARRHWQQQAEARRRKLRGKERMATH